MSASPRSALAVVVPRTSLELGGAAVRLVEAQRIEEDAALVMTWRNDPAARAASFHTEAKRWPWFVEEYLGYFDEPWPPLFGELDGERVGFVRFRRCEDPEARGRDVVDISINVAPACRGRGVGRALIVEATAQLLATGRHDAILAEVRPGNAASSRAFLGARYERIDDGFHDVHGALCPVERYLRLKQDA